MELVHKHIILRIEAKSPPEEQELKEWNIITQNIAIEKKQKKIKNNGSFFQVSILSQET